VSWNEEIEKWVMTVAMSTPHKVAFYSTENLKEWKLESTFGPEGYAVDETDWENPFVKKIRVQGS